MQFFACNVGKVELDSSPTTVARNSARKAELPELHCVSQVTIILSWFLKIK